MLRSERDFSGISLLECVVLKFDDVDAAKDADHAFRLTLGFYFHHRRFCTKRKDAVKSFPKGMGEQSAQIFAAGYIPSTFTKSVTSPRLRNALRAGSSLPRRSTA